MRKCIISSLLLLLLPQLLLIILFTPETYLHTPSHGVLWLTMSSLEGRYWIFLFNLFAVFPAVFTRCFFHRQFFTTCRFIRALYWLMDLACLDCSIRIMAFCFATWPRGVHGHVAGSVSTASLVYVKRRGWRSKIDWSRSNTRLTRIFSPRLK